VNPRYDKINVLLYYQNTDYQILTTVVTSVYSYAVTVKHDNEQYDEIKKTSLYYQTQILLINVQLFTESFQTYKITM